MVLIPGRERGEYVLFCREKNELMETWHGRRTGLEGACDVFGANDAFPIEDMDDILPGLMEDRERIYFTMGADQNFDQRVFHWLKMVRDKVRTGIHAPEEFISLTHILHDMRLYKSRQEIKSMRQAAKIAASAHRRAMQVCKPGMMEYQIEAELIHEFMRKGARSPAYASIVGGGKNSCILHYTENNQHLKVGDVLLIDAGAEYDGYASDITRTCPVSGEFTDEQRAVYDVVLAGQLAAIKMAAPGRHWNEPHDAAIESMVEGMLDLGILKGNKKTIIKEQSYKKYYMHKTGHWIGMDVHDVGDYKVDGEWRMLEPGMVMTVEPGLYLAPTRGLAKKWWNIGIRIEDDVLVTKDGFDVLSKDMPKTADDIEAIMAA